MFNFLSFSVQHALAGLWPLVWHWGTPVAIIILCFGAEVGLSMFKAQLPKFLADSLRPIQTWLLAVAIGAGLFLWGLGDGVKVEHERSIAQQAILLKQVGSVVDDVLNAPANQPQPVQKVKPGQKAVPRKAPSDPWDSPEN